MDVAQMVSQLQGVYMAEDVQLSMQIVLQIVQIHSLVAVLMASHPLVEKASLVVMQPFQTALTHILGAALIT